MPRPGPRPYECIRRAWHSDSHQPLRGALIQEIFRVVNELHSTSTRRKKEWQEKLPIVVLRAEEILYSKANSESEYAGVDTLRTRLDDAVNTMIRRDDSEEEGVYLAPCVEAALSLGCPPKKIPRGQRQIPSRFLPNGTRRNAIVYTNNNGSYRAMSGKSKNDQNTNSSSCVIGAPLSQTQDQSFTAALPMGNPSLYSVCAPPAGPIACFAPSPGYVFCQNFTLPTFEASHPLITPSLPQPGGLVQFLKSADPNAQAGLLGPVPFPMHINVDHDSRALAYVDSRSSRAQMDAQFVCRDFNGPICSTSNTSSLASSMPRSKLEISRNGCREHDQLVENSLAAVVATCTEIPAQKSLISVDTRMAPQMQEIAARPDFFLKNRQLKEIGAERDIASTHTQMKGFFNEQSRWQTCPVPKFRAFPSPPGSYRASPLQKCSTTSPPSIDVGACMHAIVDDLQLRLGPPGNEHSITSVLTGDVLASKRSRVDHGKVDDSGSNIDRLQLCTLPFSEQLTWSRC